MPVYKKSGTRVLGKSTTTLLEESSKVKTVDNSSDKNGAKKFKNSFHESFKNVVGPDLRISRANTRRFSLQSQFSDVNHQSNESTPRDMQCKHPSSSSRDQYAPDHDYVTHPAQGNAGRNSARTSKVLQVSFTQGSEITNRLSRLSGKFGPCESEVSGQLKSWVKRSFVEHQVGIIVSDMSGFTRLTREHGIVHFASIIVRMRQICLPILHHNGAIYITTEADNLIVVFPTAKGALMSAICMQKAVAQYNSSLPSEKSHFALTLNGVGVDYGPGPFVDKSDSLHGKTFTNAYVIGEDLCDEGVVMVTGDVREAVRDDPEFAKAVFRPHVAEDNDLVSRTSETTGGLFDCIMDDIDFPVADVSDDRYLHPDLVTFAKRHEHSASKDNLDKLDDHISSKYFETRTVAMFDVDYENYDEWEAHGYSADDLLCIQFECLSHLQGVLTRYGAEKVEDMLYLFSNPVDAILGVVACRSHMEQELQHAEAVNKPAMVVKGYGVHMGGLLTVPGTDVHWGDPVNTASKLGQDLADNGEIIISKEVYEASAGDPKVKKLSFDYVELQRSKVNFGCYKVNKKSDEVFLTESIPSAGSRPVGCFAKWWCCAQHKENEISVEAGVIESPISSFK